MNDLKNSTNNNLSDEEINKLRDAVLKWIELKKDDKNITPRQKFKLETKKITEKKSEPEMEPKLPQLTGKYIKKFWPGFLRLPKLPQNKKTLILSILIFLITATIIFFLSGLYYFAWDNQITKLITKIIPLPAAVVNFQIATYTDWQKQVNTLSNFYQQEKEKNSDLIIPSLKEAKNNVLERLIDYQILKQAAMKYQISVSQQEIDQQINKLIAELGSRETLEKQLNDLYKWTINDFTNEIIKPLIVKNKLGIAITLDDKINQATREKAQEILDEVKAKPEEFSELAKKYSEDVTSDLGGDLGYFGLGQMVPEFEQAAFALGVGQISDLVKTKFGFHIIKVEEKITEPEQQTTLIRARHILIRGKDLDSYLDELKKQAVIWRLISTKN